MLIAALTQLLFNTITPLVHFLANKLDWSVEQNRSISCLYAQSHILAAIGRSSAQAESPIWSQGP